MNWELGPGAIMILSRQC